MTSSDFRVSCNRGTRCALNLDEPPCTDPYARWCGRGRAARPAPIPIRGVARVFERHPRKTIPISLLPSFIPAVCKTARGPISLATLTSAGNASERRMPQGGCRRCRRRDHRPLNPKSPNPCRSTTRLPCIPGVPNNFSAGLPASAQPTARPPLYRTLHRSTKNSLCSLPCFSRFSKLSSSTSFC